MKNIEESIMYLYKSYLVDEVDDVFVPDYNLLKKGILINDKCNSDIKMLANDFWGIDGYILNQTFHKSLYKVVSSSMEQLLLEQIIHYITTYDFQLLGIYNKDTVFIPKEKLEVPNLKENINLVNITPITKVELKDKLWNLITSSIPLSKRTLECVVLLSDYLDLNEVNINKITNREVKVAMYDKIGIVPENNIEFLRYLIYKLTNTTLLIKDKNVMRLLNNSNKGIALNLINRYKELYGLAPLSEIFNRFKPLFLSLKTSEYVQMVDIYGVVITKKNDCKYEDVELNKLINKISKLSKIYHKPFVSNDLDNFITWYKVNCDKTNYVDLLTSKLRYENIWRIIKLRNYISLVNSSINERVYKIRNGRVWITKGYNDIVINDETIKLLDNIIISRLKVNVLGKRIYLKENEDIILPQSEKQFVGNIPFSSSIKINKDNMLVGIHWYNVNDNRVDLDLKLISNTYSIGWDINYREGDKLIFTGDMTNAPYPDGASEYIYINRDINDMVLSIKVNNYTMNVDDIEYDIIVARKDKTKLTRNYIVDPNDIIIKIPRNVIEVNKFEHSLGNIVVSDNDIKLIFNDLTTSNKKTASNDNTEELLRNYLQHESEIKCRLRDYLEMAGAIIVDNKDDVDIDLSIDNLNKNTIVELLR